MSFYCHHQDRPAPELQVSFNDSTREFFVCENCLRIRDERKPCKDKTTSAS